jgi:AbrB family looped-hinge helix DNA binding protein
MTPMSKITSKGQVTIPEAIRESFGLLPGCEVEFVVEQGKILIRRELQRGKLDHWVGALNLDAEVDAFIESLRAVKSGKKRKKRA